MRIAPKLLAAAIAAAMLVPAAASARHAVLHGLPQDNSVAYQLNAAHTGSIEMSTGFAAPLKEAWSRSVGTGFGGEALVADGKVFFGTITGDSEMTTYALDLATGDTVWSKKSTPSLPALAYDNGTLFSQNLGGKLISFDGASGAQHWTMQLPKGSFFPTHPIAVNGAIMTGGGGDDGGYVYSVSEADGSLNWLLQGLPDETGTPAYGDNGLYVTYSCQYYKLKLKSDGRPRLDWHTDLHCNGVQPVIPVYSDKRLYLADFDNANVVLSSKTGQSVDTFGGATNPTMFRDAKGKQYGVSRSQNGLNCWRVSTGTIAWLFAGDSHISTQPIAINGYVAVGADSGMLYLLDGKSGKIKWSTNTKMLIQSLSAGQGTLVAVGYQTVKAFVPK